MRLFVFGLLAVSLSAGPARVVETTEPFAPLSGTALSGRPVVNVTWADQLGHRGFGQWTTGDSHTIRWTVEQVPVRTGPNQITVSIVDDLNQTTSQHFVVLRRAEAFPVSNRHVVEGDILVKPNVTRVGTLGFSDAYIQYLWPSVSGVFQVPYSIQGSSANLTTAINSFNATFAGVIQFVPLGAQTNYVTMVIDPSLPNGEGQSSVGMQGNQQFLYCSPGCVVPTFLHEMGHTVGLLHEHQRPDRATWVTFTNANADEPLVFDNFTFASFNDQALALYDHQSVMHYGAFDFSKNGLPVLESLPAGIPLSNDTGYSPGDVDQVRRLYSATPSSVTINTNPAGLSIIVDGTTYAAPQTFAWALNSTHTLNLPADPQVTSPSDGATYKFSKWNDSGARSHTITVFGGTGTLTSPATKPAVTVYQANFIRLWPFTLGVTPTGSGTATVTPSPVSEYHGTFFPDRQLITMTATPNTGQNFYGWFGPPYPESANPRPFLVFDSMTGTLADFTTNPVTTIGASLTGPNPQIYPGMYGHIDTGFWYLPQAFDSNQWAVNSQHTINVDNPESPITTNVRYTWNNWSDGGAQSHAVTQPASGAQFVSASFTPVYRTYGEPYGSCAGSVTFSPASPTNDGFYADGTQLTVTAVPNPQFPGIVFAGWSGDLTGSVNPQNFTIHNQFIPNANFNAISTPIAITGYSPVTSVKSAAALLLTVKGTGFTPTTYSYWNGGYRPNTYVSATQIKVQLNAGDIATAGAQDVFVGNYDTVGANTCGNTFESQYVVKSSLAATPQLQVTKTHTGNFTKGQMGAVFTVTVSNLAGSKPTSGTVTLTDTIPTGLVLVSMAGTGWSCTSNYCNRGDALNAGKAYPAITVTVNVNTNAPASVTNKVAATGGGSPPASAQNVAKIQ
jgi:uncharacterized repeat protein (TIGR01451 family)